jgi:hypothetical protein
MVELTIDHNELDAALRLDLECRADAWPAL